ncbi:MAG: D-glycero-beta-D-manno-heptose 1,7-bisphosphate 7-phosphatase [Acidobacteriota bacterium]
MRPAIFMDRDGTVSYEVGYVNHPERYDIMPGSAEAIAKINSSGYLAIVITNQAGVARGYFREEMINAIHEKLKKLLAEKGARLDGIYYCPHHPDVGDPPYRQRCCCRKPEPGMLLQAQKELDIDLSRSYIIGDSIKDIQTGANAGVRGILVLTGYGKGEFEYGSDKWKVKPIHVAENLLDAVKWVLSGKDHEDE